MVVGVAEFPYLHLCGHMGSTVVVVADSCLPSVVAILSQCLKVVAVGPAGEACVLVQARPIVMGARSLQLADTERRERLVAEALRSGWVDHSSVHYAVIAIALLYVGFADRARRHVGKRQERHLSGCCTIRTTTLLAKRNIAFTCMLTKVPRSYQTSEIFGLRRIAREYASRASRYWLIW